MEWVQITTNNHAHQSTHTLSPSPIILSCSMEQSGAVPEFVAFSLYNELYYYPYCTWLQTFFRFYFLSLDLGQSNRYSPVPVAVLKQNIRLWYVWHFSDCLRDSRSAVIYIHSAAYRTVCIIHAFPTLLGPPNPAHFDLFPALTHPDSAHHLISSDLKHSEDSQGSRCVPGPWTQRGFWVSDFME